MDFTFNGNTPEIVTYNGYDVLVVKWNGTTVWEKNSDTGDTPTPDTGETITHPYNEVWYTTTNGAAITPNIYNFSDMGTLVSNTYSDGKGILTFANDVQKVGGYNFSGNTTLKTVEFPDSVLWFDAYPFKGCTNLQSITIGKNLATIGNYTLSGCSSLSSITISSTIPPLISSGVFNGVKRNGVLNYPTGSTYASTNWLNSSSAYYPKYYNWSGNATGDTTSVLSARLTLNNSTTRDFSYVGGIIPASAYTSFSASCTSAELISATTINSYAFRGCSAMTSITINNGVHTINHNAFLNCTNLTSITIPDSVYWLRDYAFQNCTNLENIHIGKGVHRIGNYDTNTSNNRSPFNNCNNISSITIDSSNTVFDSRNNCNAIILTSSNTLIMACKNTVIPNTVSSIGQQAFHSCQISSITIPSSVTSIGDYAFQYCPIASFNYDGTVEQWSNVSLGSDYYDTYYWTTNVVHCTNGDVCLYSCRGIADNQILYTTTDGQTMTPTLMRLNIDSNTYTDGLGDIQFDDDIYSIGDNLIFSDLSTLETVILPDSVTSFNSSGFYNCTSLTSITIGESDYYEIQSDAFQDCTSLVEINVYPKSGAYFSIDSNQSNLPSGGTIHIPSNMTEFDFWELYEFAQNIEWDIINDL